MGERHLPKPPSLVSGRDAAGSARDHEILRNAMSVENLELLYLGRDAAAAWFGNYFRSPGSGSASDTTSSTSSRQNSKHRYALGWLDPGRPRDGRVLLHDGEQLQRKPPDPRGIRVFVAGGVARLVVRRETWADLLARDIEYELDLNDRGGGAMASLREQALRRKPVIAMTEESGTDTGKGELARSIGLFQLALFGVGATIGTGIFIVLTQAVPIGGPAVILSFVFAGTVAGLTAICYAELASAVPVSGSSYSYAYATLGEGVAMVVAACLLLEYGVSSAAVAVGWSEYLNELFGNLFGFTIPDALANAPEQGGVFNMPAVILIVLCTLLLIRGASESAKVNSVMVLIKIGVLVMFVVLGLQGWNSDNLSDFTPFGLGGVTSAAGIIFFSYIGLDAVSTAGEEVKNPRRTMPLAIIIALVTVTTVYIAVAVVAVAAQPVAEFEDQEAGLAAILEQVTGSSRPATILAAGAVISIFSVTLVTIYGQTRILFAMGRDGMVPTLFHKLNPRTLTPVPATIIAAVVDLAPGRPAADQLPGRDDEHRHAGGVPDRLDRRDGPATDRTRPATRLQGPAVSRDAHPVHRGMHLDHPDLRAVTIYVFFGWAAVALLWYFFYGRHHADPRTAGGGRARPRHDHRRRHRPGGARQGGAAPGRDAGPLGGRRPRPLCGGARALATRAPPGWTPSTAPISSARRTRRWTRPARDCPRTSRPHPWSTTRAPLRPACWRWPSSTTPPSSWWGRPRPAASGEWPWAASPTG